MKFNLNNNNDGDPPALTSQYVHQYVGDPLALTSLRHPRWSTRVMPPSSWSTSVYAQPRTDGDVTRTPRDATSSLQSVSTPYWEFRPPRASWGSESRESSRHVTSSHFLSSSELDLRLTDLHCHLHSSECTTSSMYRSWDVTYPTLPTSWRSSLFMWSQTYPTESDRYTY
jgi:hypothetical protein